MGSLLAHLRAQLMDLLGKLALPFGGERVERRLRFGQLLLEGALELQLGVHVRRSLEALRERQPGEPGAGPGPLAFHGIGGDSCKPPRCRCDPLRGQFPKVVGRDAVVEGAHPRKGVTANIAQPFP